MCRIMKLISPGQQRQLKPCRAFTESSTRYSSLLQIFMIAISRKQIRNTMYLESQLLLGKKILILLCPFYYENCFFLPVFWILFKILFFFPSYFNSSSTTTIAFFDSHPPLHPHFWFHFLMYPFLLTSLMSDFYPQDSFKTDFFKKSTSTMIFTHLHSITVCLLLLLLSY